MRENRTPGSVRGLSGNWQSYRHQLPLDANDGNAQILSAMLVCQPILHITPPIPIMVLGNPCDGVLVQTSTNPRSIHYCDLLAHYGAVAVPCRVNDPNSKGKSRVGDEPRPENALKGQRFESLEET